MTQLQILYVDKYQHEATSRGHSVIVDEPEKVGGHDKGMNPYEYLLTALGGCTAITLRMYAERKGWDLHDVTIELSHENVHAEDCEECETGEGKLTVLRRRIQLTGDLDDEQRGRLLEIADKCPVHRTLEGTIEVLDEE